VVDCGDSIGAWLDNYLSHDGLRLVYHISDEGHRKHASGAGNDKFPNFDTKDLVMLVETTLGHRHLNAI